MPTVKERSDKNCRMDLRLTQNQRENYERAASLKGQSLTQWATAHLDESSRKDIAEASTTYLSSEGFEAFCAILDAPMPQAAVDLLNRKSVWE